MKPLFDHHLSSRMILVVIMCLLLVSMSSLTIIAQEPTVLQIGNVLQGNINVIHSDPAPDSGGVYEVDAFLNTTTGQRIILNMPVLEAANYVGQRVQVVGSPVISNNGNTVQSGSSPTSFNVDSVTVLDNSGGFSTQDSSEWPVLGNKQNINILCSFNDTTPNDTYDPYPDDGINQQIPVNYRWVSHGYDYFDSLMSETEPGLGHYFREISSLAYNSNDSFITLGTTTIDQWFEIGASANSYYNGTYSVQQLGNLCIQAADQGGVNFSGISGVNFMFDARYAGFAQGSTGEVYNIDGGSVELRTTWNPPFSWQDQYFIGHEIGHSFRMFHTGSNPALVYPPDWPAFPYDSYWDIMSGGGEGPASTIDATIGGIAPSTSAANIIRAGWMPIERYVEVPQGALEQVTIDSLIDPVGTSSTLFIDVPLNDIHPPYSASYYIEAHHERSYDDNQADSGVLIYLVDGWEFYNLSGGPTARLMDGDGNGDINDDGAVFTVGETFTDSTNNVTISVVATDGVSTFTVIVANSAPPNELINLDSTPEPVITAPIMPTISWDHDGLLTDSYWVTVTPPGGTAIWTEFGTGICSDGSCSTALPANLFTSNGQYIWNVCAVGSTGTTCAAQPQIITVNVPAPTPRTVTATGNFTTPPLDISYGWDHDDISEWYNLLVEFDQGGGNYASVYNGWHSTADSCNSPCSVTPSITYQNGDYRVSVASYSAFFSTGDFGAYDTFTINIANSLATNIRVDGQSLPTTVSALPVDPVITWTHDGVSESYNTWVGGPNTITSGWFAASHFGCNPTCTLNTPVNGGPTYINGDYQIWIQGWNSVTGTGDWVSANFTVDIAEPTVPVVSPNVNLTDEDRPVFTWAYDGVTEWFNMWVGGEGRTVISGWFPAGDFGCNSTCTMNLPAGVTLWDGEYGWWMQLYSLGGTSDWVNPSNFTVDALDMYVGVSGPDPAIVFDYDGVTEWFNIYVGGPTTPYPTAWVSAADLNCASTCTLVTDNNLYQNGNYQVWMQGWSTINGTSGWMSHDFVYPIPVP